MRFFIVTVFFLSILLTSALIFAKFYREKPKESPKLEVFPSPTPSAAPSPMKVKVSIPYWDQESAVKSLRENVDAVDYISLFWYFLDNEGRVKKYKYAKEDLSIINFAQDNGIKVEVVITNLPESGSWDSERVEKIINSNELRNEHVEEIVALVERLGVDGVDIDYEQLDKDLKDDFSHFLEDLGEALDKKGKYLGVALHPKSDDGIGKDNGSSAQDWDPLSKAADNLYIMAFGEHWDEGEAGPIASLAWVERIIKYAQKQGIDKQKLFLTVPLYGYVWEKDSDDTAKGLTHKDVVNLLKKYEAREKWDDGAKSPHFSYQDGSSWDVWFENARSVEEKINLAQKYGFGGVSFWRLGGEDPEIWNNLPKLGRKSFR